MMTIATVKQAVAAYYGVSVAEIDSRRRLAGLVRPRHVAMALSRRLTGKSLPVIGRHFRRTHRVVFYACRRMERMAGEDAGLARDMAAIAAVLGGGHE
jgi:chromosomal replication initiator protein